MIELRLVKITMVASLALFTFMVTYDNITDYNSNFAFVQHVLSMDTTFPGHTLTWRAIDTPSIWHAAYALIILGEALTCIAYTIATVSLLKTLRSSAAQFNRAKRFAYIATGLGFLVWFTGFMVIGGEWFAMWQSPDWNGQPAAFRFYTALLGVAIFVGLEDRDPPG
jgi:predicted small integral membrane protein